MGKERKKEKNGESEIRGKWGKNEEREKKIHQKIRKKKEGKINDKNFGCIKVK